MKQITTLIITTLILFSCGTEEKTHTIAQLPAILVKTNKTSFDSKSANTIQVSGTVQSGTTANLSTRIMGFVTKVNVKVGSKVRKGQSLVRINSSDLQAKAGQINANIQKAQVAVQSAKKDFDRYTALFTQESVTQKELDDITSRYEMAKSSEETVRQMKNEINAQFSYTNIKAPFTGIVTGKFVEVGDMANPGIPLVSLESPNNFEVVAMVPESEISNIKKGQKVDVLIKSIGENIKGTVSEIGVSAKHTGGQYLVTIKLDKKNKIKLFSGMFTTVKFTFDKAKTNQKNNKIFIPINSIVEKGSLKGIYTVSNQNKALLRWLRLGKSNGTTVEVLSGLSDGEEYIISAEGKLFNGVPLTIQ